MEAEETLDETAQAADGKKLTENDEAGSVQGNDQAGEKAAEDSVTAAVEASATTSAEASVATATEAAPETKIAELEAKLAESHNQFLRKAADFENFRKRMNQEKQSAIEFANQALLLDLIPIIDNFERAIIAGESSNDMAAFLDGVKMIEKQLTTALENKWGLKRFVSAGQPFDPNLHEALYMEKSAEVSEPTVQEDLFKGYFLKERVIRAAKVKVLMPEEQGTGSRE